MSAENERAAFLTALAQDPSPTALGPVFAGIGYWPAWNVSVVAGFDVASGTGCTECATEITNRQRGTEATPAVTGEAVA
jgi:hypothetical protein